MNNYNKTLNNSSHTDASDSDLMLSLQVGQDKALNELMRRHKNKLFYFVTRYTKNEDISYDIVQETFLRVYTKSNTFNPSYKFKTWLYQIALNLCRDYSRKKKLRSFFSLDSWKKGEDEGSFHEVLSSDENIENLAQHRQTLEIVGKEIDALPHKLKSALILFALEGKSQEECARILGVTIKTIETRVYRARKILLQKMSKKY